MIRSIHEELEKKIQDKTKGHLKTILLTIVRIYRTLQISLYGYTINPVNGEPQEDTLAPVLFNLYVDDVLIKMNTGFTEIRTQGLADNTALQASRIETLQTALDRITYILAEKKLKINSKNALY